MHQRVLGVGVSSSSSMGGLVMPSGLATCLARDALQSDVGCSLWAQTQQDYQLVARLLDDSLTTTASNSAAAASSTSARSSRAARDVRRLGAAAGQPAHQLLPRRRREEHAERVGHHRAHLPRALQVDLEQRRLARPPAARAPAAWACRSGSRRSQRSPAARRPRPSRRTSRRRRSGSDAVDLTGPRRPGGDRHRHPELRVAPARAR